MDIIPHIVFWALIALAMVIALARIGGQNCHGIDGALVVISNSLVGAVLFAGCLIAIAIVVA